MDFLPMFSLRLSPEVPAPRVDDFRPFRPIEDDSDLFLFLPAKSKIRLNPKNASFEKNTKDAFN
jgi:hypothetical protein